MYTVDYAAVGFLIACMTWAAAMTLKPDVKPRAQGSEKRRAKFIRSSRESLKPRNSSFLGQDRVDKIAVSPGVKSVKPTGTARRSLSG
jgi:hypothetical protein